MHQITLTDIIIQMIKYALEGIGVAIAMMLLAKKAEMMEVAGVAIIAAVMFAALDFLAPSVGLTARQGAGFGLGARLVNFPMPMPAA